MSQKQFHQQDAAHQAKEQVYHSFVAAVLHKGKNGIQAIKRQDREEYGCLGSRYARQQYYKKNNIGVFLFFVGEKEKVNHAEQQNGKGKAHASHWQQVALAKQDKVFDIKLQQVQGMQG